MPTSEIRASLKIAPPEDLAKLRCRFGCDAPVGIFHVPAGCICWSDPVQALCMQHFIKAESTGPITCIVDFRISP